MKPKSLLKALCLQRHFSSFPSILKSFNPTLPIEEALTIPSSWYTSKELYEKEIEHIWKKSWVLVDSFANLCKKGDFKTGDVFEQPYVLMRTETAVKAFYNVCLHHGAVIEKKPAGNCEELQCQYHGWTYDIEGKLVKCSAMKNSRNFNMKEKSLKNIDCYQYGDMFFLNFDEKKKDMSEFDGMLKNFEDHHRKYNFDPLFKGYAFVEEKNYVINCNWKVFVDNWLDGGYHVPFLHQGLTKEVTTKKFQSINHHKTNFQHAPGESSRIGDHLIYSFLYPNCMVSTYRPWIDISYVLPLAVDRCVVRMQWLVSAEKARDKAFIEESVKQSKIIQEEDVFMSQKVQRGMRSGGITAGRYSPVNETGIYEFHKNLYNDLLKGL